MMEQINKQVDSMWPAIEEKFTRGLSDFDVLKKLVSPGPSGGAEGLVRLVPNSGSSDTIAREVNAEVDGVFDLCPDDLEIGMRSTPLGDELETEIVKWAASVRLAEGQWLVETLGVRAEMQERPLGTNELDALTEAGVRLIIPCALAKECDDRGFEYVCCQSPTTKGVISMPPTFKYARLKDFDLLWSRRNGSTSGVDLNTSARVLLSGMAGRALSYFPTIDPELL